MCNGIGKVIATRACLINISAIHFFPMQSLIKLTLARVSSASKWQPIMCNVHVWFVIFSFHSLTRMPSYLDIVRISLFILWFFPGITFKIQLKALISHCIIRPSMPLEQCRPAWRIKDHFTDGRNNKLFIPPRLKFNSLRVIMYSEA